jgi:hypothetical protein
MRRGDRCAATEVAGEASGAVVMSSGRTAFAPRKEDWVQFRLQSALRTHVGSEG